MQASFPRRRILLGLLCIWLIALLFAGLVSHNVRLAIVLPGLCVSIFTTYLAYRQENLRSGFVGLLLFWAAVVPLGIQLGLALQVAIGIFSTIFWIDFLHETTTRGRLFIEVVLPVLPICLIVPVSTRRWFQSVWQESILVLAYMGLVGNTVVLLVSAATLGVPVPIEMQLPGGYNEALVSVGPGILWAVGMYAFASRAKTEQTSSATRT